MHRRHFLKLPLVFALGLSGCVTAHMYGPRYAYERLSSVLISRDGNHLVAVTDKHDYVFDSTSQLSAIIQSDLHPYASARFQQFHTAHDGATAGVAIIDLNGLPASMEQQARGLGFTNDGQNRLTLRIPLHGTMYKGRGERSDTRYPLNHTYMVQIEQDPSPLSTTGKILATPITAAADGALILSGSVLIMLASPFLEKR